MSVTNSKLYPIVLCVWVNLIIGGLTVNAAIFEDFQFGDPAGTLIEEAANSANPGNMFDIDSDNDAVMTNGLGQLNASLKNNTLFGTNYVDNDPLTTGTIYGVIGAPSRRNGIRTMSRRRMTAGNGNSAPPVLWSIRSSTASTRSACFASV